MKLDYLFKLTPLLGIDIGTSRVRMWLNDSGVLVDEATCLAVDNRTQKVIAVGNEALAMQGRVGQNIQVFFPMRKGEMTDTSQVSALLSYLLQVVFPSSVFFRPVVMISVSSDLTTAKRNILVETVASLGVKEVVTINQSLAAAIGSGVPIADASGSFVLHLGAGVVEGTVISLGTSVVNQVFYQAGDYLDNRIKTLIAHRHALDISLETAREIKHQIAGYGQSEKSKLVSGQDAVESSPREIEINSDDLNSPIDDFFNRIDVFSKKILTKIPPELTVDIIEKGILLSGGMANLSGLAEALINSLGVPVSVVENPDKVVIEGIGTALENLDEFKSGLSFLSSLEDN